MVTTLTPLRIVLGTLLLLPAWAPGDPPLAPPPLQEKDHPVAWKIAELNAALPNPADGASATVLVWEVIEFDGVFTVEERCLAFKRYDKPSATGQGHALGVLWRQPKTTRPAWHPTVRYVKETDRFGDVKLIPVVATEEYKEIPTEDELRAFLKKHNWHEKLAPQALDLRIRGAPAADVRYVPKLVDGGVCKGVWKKAFDREPATDLFPELAPRVLEKK